MSRAWLRLLVASILTLAAIPLAASPASACVTRRGCETGLNDGAVEVSGGYSGAAVAGLAPSASGDPVDYEWNLRPACSFSDGRNDDACTDVFFRECPAEPGHDVRFLTIERRPLARGEGAAPTTSVGGVAAGTAAGTAFGQWEIVTRTCVDLTALADFPSPAEVFAFLQRLPLPQLATSQQPPGIAVVGLPVVFFTTGPTAQDFAVDIRGYTVAIHAVATTFTWHTGDAPYGESTEVSTDPGHPYPDQTVTHDYRSGTYTAHLTTTWSATYTVNGGPAAAVPGSTTTDGAPVTFRVVEAHAVLTDPYD